MVLNRRNLLKVAVTSIGLVGGGSVVLYKLQTTRLKADESLEEIKLNFEPTTKWDFNWDKREPNYLIKPKSKSLKARLHEEKVQPPPVDDLDLIKKHSSRATRHLFLIRHGQYEIKEKDSEKKILTLLGREQAEFAGKHLKELSVGRFSYNKLHHSSMIRAIETANIIKTHLPSDIPVHTDPLLCEGAPIAPEPPIGSWRPELYVFQDGPRIEAAFRKYFHRAPPEQLEDSYEIVVCHANVIRYFFCRALQFPPEAWLRFDLGHASVTHVIIRPDGRVNCRVLGGTGFQPSSKLSS